MIRGRIHSRLEVRNPEDTFDLSPLYTEASSGSQDCLCNESVFTICCIAPPLGRPALQGVGLRKCSLRVRLGLEMFIATVDRWKPTSNPDLRS